MKMKWCVAVFTALCFMATPVVATAALTIVVHVKSTKANGKAWDAFGGKPDPYIIVDGRSYKAQKCKNKFVCAFQVSGHGTVNVAVWDKDVARDDFVGQTSCSKGRTCRGGQASITIK